MWIQGGPGQAATAVGDRMEIGPLDVDGNARPTTWVKQANVLFVDSPAGVGFSYVTGNVPPPSTDAVATNDLHKFLIYLFNNGELREFQDTALYIFGESYGGKFAPQLAKKLLSEGRVRCNLKRVVLMSPWTSPIDNLVNYGKKLHQCGTIDDRTRVDVDGNTSMIQAYANAGRYDLAWHDFTTKLNIKNVKTLYNCVSGSKDIDSAIYEKLTEEFNSEDFRRKLEIIPDHVKFISAKKQTFISFKQDGLRPAVKEVQYLLKKGVNVTVMVGQLDIIVNTIGTERWVYNMEWAGQLGFREAERKSLYRRDDEWNPVAYQKRYQNFDFFWIVGSGHMIPRDVPETAYSLMKHMLSANAGYSKESPAVLIAILLLVNVIKLSID
ncbi:retinoid-inducible serine carboxypeptidase-like isoform X2 [Tubulanus polymorphus]